MTYKTYIIMLQIKIIKQASLEFRTRLLLLKMKMKRQIQFYEKLLFKNTSKSSLYRNMLKKTIEEKKQKEQKEHIVKSAIEGIVFIKTTKNTKIFMGEIIDILVCKDKFSRLKSLKGMVIGLSIESAEIMLFGDTSEISPGNIWRNTNQIASIPCGPQFLGRVVDCMGNTLDGEANLTKLFNIFAKVPGVCARERVSQPLFTGILSIDSLVPIGKGQRQLIIGDRKIGKTSIAIETIINQQYTLCDVCSGINGTYCFYVAIGQKLSSIRRIIYRFKKKKEH